MNPFDIAEKMKAFGFYVQTAKEMMKKLLIQL